jgi:pSer/pThr/pTyr-binding forkhead associated (FHA) protein
MSASLILIALRILLALALYAFLAMILLTLWRDIRQATQPGVQTPEAYLELRQEETASRAFSLSEVNLIGRAADNTIALSHETVSAYHARLSFQGGQWWLEDLDSRNGTTVNELALESPLVLTYGDRINFGQIQTILFAGLPKQDA